MQAAQVGRRSATRHGAYCAERICDGNVRCARAGWGLVAASACASLTASEAAEGTDEGDGCLHLGWSALTQLLEQRRRRLL